MRKLRVTRLVIFGAVAAAHVLLLVFLAVRIDATAALPDAPVPVMKLADIAEETPPPPPPPPPEKKPEAPQSAETVAETVAETTIETEEVPPPPEPGYQPPAAETYLPMHKVSRPPVFAEAEIRRALVYPLIARRSGVEGMVYLELFIDRQGRVQRVDILKENPANYGFGEAAARAFRGRSCTPAESNGAAVAVRYRYPVRFKIR